MMNSNLMRMRDPKVLAHHIERMKWSNRMDLIAMSTDKGTRTCYIYLTCVVLICCNLSTIWDFWEYKLIYMIHSSFRWSHCATIEHTNLMDPSTAIWECQGLWIRLAAGCSCFSCWYVLQQRIALLWLFFICCVIITLICHLLIVCIAYRLW